MKDVALLARLTSIFMSYEKVGIFRAEEPLYAAHKAEVRNEENVRAYDRSMFDAQMRHGNMAMRDYYYGL